MLWLVKIVILYLTSWVLWRFLRRFIVSSPLDNIPGPTSRSFFKGVFPYVFNPNGWNYHEHIAEKYGRVIKLKGLFGENQLYVFDPKAMHHIVVKDQHIYEETAGFLEGNRLFFGEGLLATLGEQHRRQRKMLNAVFSIAHMRDMTPIFHNVGHKLRDSLIKKVGNGPSEVDILSWMSRTALELIAQTGLGCSFDPLTDDATPHRYSSAAKSLIPLAYSLHFWRIYVLPTLVKFGPPRLRRFLVDLLPSGDIRALKDVVDIMAETSIELYESKIKALKDGDEALKIQVGEGKDIMSILMRANMTVSAGDALTKEEVLGQMSTLTFAATDTTSNALSRTLHLLATHPEVQRQLRKELRDAKANHGTDLPYDTLVALPFLDAVCRETMRLYAPIAMVMRIAHQDAILPLSSPITGVDGSEISEIPIPSGTNIIVGIMAANRNPEIWGPDAGEWKPERWLQPLPESVLAAHLPGVYSHLMTFLGGGRACIGFKFSQLEMKVVLSLLVDTFEFSLGEKEIVWQMTAISQPTVKGAGVAEMPLMMRLAETAV